MDLYEIERLITALVELRGQLIAADVPSNPALLKITDERLNYLINQIPNKDE